MSDAIERLNAALEGRYQVEREIGEGGMAKVFLARDLKHNRNVALKVLKPELAAVVGAERFLTEIETTANLQHPHILPLFDSGEADGFLFYVMPFVEGETLRERIDRDKQLPVEEAVSIATSVAKALQHAHDRGVIHRDIKPGNILLQDGQPVVSDFGIALAVGSAGGARLTETGLSVGTPFYMAPEQATGDQAIGPACDIYALGAVLYEMLVGEPPFVGNTAQAVLGKILQGAPVSPTSIRRSIPSNVDAAVRKALEKLPADRFAGAQALAAALADPSFRHGEALASVGSAGGSWNRLTVGAVLLVAAAASLATWSVTRDGPDEVTRFAVEMPEGHLTAAMFSDLAMSPDGRVIVHVGPGEARTRLWVRRTGQLDVAPLPGTDGAINPVFSSDGERIAFQTIPGPALKIASLAGAPPVTIAADAYQVGGLAWGPGWLYVDTGPGISRVRESGGALEAFTSLDEEASETSHNWPHALPNGRGVLFTVWYTPIQDRGQFDIAVADAETGQHRVLLRGVYARYVHPGYLLYVSSEGALLAAPFDQDAMEVTGASVTLAEGIRITGIGAVSLAASQEGSLVYVRGGTGGFSDGSELVWVARNGSVEPVDPGWTFTIDGSTNSIGWSLSPDGSRVALTEVSETGRDIWVKRLPDGARTRLTYSESDDRAPRWSPDGDRVTFVSDRETDLEMWSKRWDGTGEAELVFDYEGRIPEAFWSADGEWVIFRTAGLDTEGAEGSRDIGAIRPGVDTEPRSLVATQYIEEGAALSPDGRWLAYSSNETGQREVFVRPFPDTDSGKWPVSQEGGQRPRWSADGREIFFLGGTQSSNSRMMVARVETDRTFALLGLEALFEVGPDFHVVDVGDFYDYDPRGDRFLMGRIYAGAETVPSSLVLVQNLDQELRRMVPN